MVTILAEEAGAFDEALSTFFERAVAASVRTAVWSDLRCYAA
jgi:hypothetical protein